MINLITTIGVIGQVCPLQDINFYPAGEKSNETGGTMDLPKRKPTRLKEYDYSSYGKYFLTVCVKDKQCLLGKIVGDPPRMLKSSKGEILDRCIKLMSEKYPDISVEKYIIMPNHFHIIVGIDNKKENKENPQNNKLSKYVSLLKRYCNMEYKENIWQRSFYDHIIRDEDDYLVKWEYIDTNIQRWKKE